MEKPISDRLFEDSDRREARRKQLEEELRAKELIDPNTGSKLFSPHSLHEKGERTPEDVARRLLQLGREAEERKKELAEKYTKCDHNLTFSPKLSEKSKAIAEATTRRPLYEPKPKVSGNGSPEKEKVLESEGSTQRKQHKRSGSDPSGFFRRSERAEQIRQEKLREMAVAVASQELSECTFQPHISRRSLDLFRSAHNYGVPMDMQGFGGQDLTPQGGVAVPNTSASDAYSLRQPRFSESVHQSTSPHQATPSVAAALSSGKRHADPQSSSASAAKSAQNLFSSMTADTSLPTGGLNELGDRPQRSGVEGVALDDYVSAFERQMFAVLEDWRRLEEV